MTQGGIHILIQLDHHRTEHQSKMVLLRPFEFNLTPNICRLPASLYSHYDPSILDTSTFLNTSPIYFSPSFSVGSSPRGSPSNPDSIQVNPPDSVRPIYDGRSPRVSVEDPWVKRAESKRQSEQAMGTGKSKSQDTGAKAKKQPSIDGRSFFQKARSSLSYDQFTALLWQVKW